MNKVLRRYSRPPVSFFCLALLIGIGFYSSGCKKKAADVVPNVYVDINIFTTDPAFSPLNVIGGYAYYNGGSKGILIYRKSQNEFMAYDRNCTYKAADGNVITVDASGLTATDAVCGSKFLITDGSVNHSPAVNALKRYQTSFDGTVLHIYN